MPEKNDMASFKIKRSIIDTMVESKLDPTEFNEFMSKYAEFIDFGLLFKKMETIGRPEFDSLSVMNALSAGINCFDSFLIDFKSEFDKRSIEKPI